MKSSSPFEVYFANFRNTWSFFVAFSKCMDELYNTFLAYNTYNDVQIQLYYTGLFLSFSRPAGHFFLGVIQ